MAETYVAADEVMAAPKPDKRPHFTVAEEVVLVDECIKRWSILDGKLTPTLTMKSKKAAWQEIAK